MNLSQEGFTPLPGGRGGAHFHGIEGNLILRLIADLAIST